MSKKRKNGYLGDTFYSGEHWRNKKQDFKNYLRKVGLNTRRCYACDVIGKRTHVHHVTYERVHEEKMSDLVILCEPCHQELHTIQRGSNLSVYRATEHYLQLYKKSLRKYQQYLDTQDPNYKPTPNKRKKKRPQYVSVRIQKKEVGIILEALEEHADLRLASLWEKLHNKVLTS